MADFRKWLYAFAVVALLAGLTVPASAQTFQTCIGGAVNPVIRAEGYTELAGDLTITCSGGSVTPPTGTVPAVTINVSMNTTITSKITSTAFNPNFNEALLLIDEPGLGTTGNQLLNCGAPGAPFNTTTSGAGVCSIINDGAAVGTNTGIYNGAHGAVIAGVPSNGHPNVFQGRQVSGSGNQIIQFIGVPLDGGTHTLRITNLRGNVVQLSGGHITNPNFGLGLSFVTIVTFTSPNSVNAQLIQVVNGSIRNGLDSVTGTSVAAFLQCTFTTTRHPDAGTVTLLEGFPSAWKVRNWRQIQDNGSFVGTPDWRFNNTSNFSTLDLTQNVPNAFFSTESGFMYPPPPVIPPGINPPQGISNTTGTPPGNQPFTDSPDTGISLAGSASNGTRFAVKFANIPAGTTISVQRAIDLINVSGGNSNVTGRMLAVGGTDANGAGGTVGVGGTITSGVNFTVIYEVIFEDPLAIESATIQVTANVSPFDGTNPQVGVTATAQAGFAPFYDNGAGSTAGCPMQLGSPISGDCGTGFAPIPRFVTGFLPTTPVNLFSFSRCACDMLFPWVVGTGGAGGITTSIVIANTSADPGIANGFTASPQSGRVTFWFYGTSGVSFDPTFVGAAAGNGSVVASQQTTVSIPAGSYVAFVISPDDPGASVQTAGNGLKAIGGNFAGYVIAQSEFQYCHGIASISTKIPTRDGGFSPQTYLGLVLDKAEVLTGRFFFDRENGGSIRLGSPQDLQRTNQVFADELDH